MGGIVRYENTTVNRVTNGVDAFGEYTTSTAPWFTSRAVVKDVRNSLKINDRYREYQELVTMTFSYTPNTKLISNNQADYSITWNSQEWRITDIYVSDDRMKVTFMCYKADPSVPV